MRCYLKIKVILCTFNNFVYLKQQIDSILNQKKVETFIEIFDDSPKEKNKELEEIISGFPNDRVKISPGTKTSYADNFLYSLINSDSSFPYYAFSDQDDVWEEWKIFNSISKMKKFEKVPCLYGSRTIITDEDNNKIGESKNFYRPKKFENAIVQNVAGGNTMLINKPLKLFIEKINLEKELIVSHDWTLYQIVTGSNFKFIYDNAFSVRYRQHGGNQVGSNLSISQIFKRANSLLNGDFKNWNTRNLLFLQRNREFLSDTNKSVLDAAIQIRNSNGFYGVFLLIKSGIYRQKWYENFGLFMAVLFRRF